ncbi:membrane dipeptidase [Phytohabitans kaempferiae]|uniref:Membrane dipeptidase n=1 Tax=Phytohabitans kaempferiae TaxID=1620943 RepID=A0ABV6M3V2_9ACTN
MNAKNRLVVDALQSSNFTRERFLEIREGGIDCIHATVVIWEDARTTLDLMGTWNRLFRENDDLIAMARNGQEIRDVAASGRVAVVLGFQNASSFEDDLDLVEVFFDLGIRVAQLTYNIQNHVGASCYETEDAGLTRFGGYVVGEMNRLGMLVDLSHVGERTSLDAIERSARPVAITHANPAGVWPHPRNKSDEVLRKLAARGGVLGVAPYAHLTGGGPVSLEEWTSMVAYAVDLIGVDHVGIGSDASHGWDDEKLQWIRKGRWSHETQLGPASADAQGWLPWPDFFKTPAMFPVIEQGLRDKGFNDVEVDKLVGGNWMRIFDEGLTPSGGAPARLAKASA